MVGYHASTRHIAVALCVGMPLGTRRSKHGHWAASGKKDWEEGLGRRIGKKDLSESSGSV